MKAIRIFLIVMSIFVMSEYLSLAQSKGSTYKAAIGLRAGETSGITFKIHTNPTSGLEFIAGVSDNWFSLTGLYEKNAPAFNVAGMEWYYGGGGHLAFAADNYYHEGHSYTRAESYALGLDGIVGLEYKIPEIPFAISLDIKPLIEIDGNGYFFFAFDPGFGLKFTF
jgi:hypothetical protein